MDDIKKLQKDIKNIQSAVNSREPAIEWQAPAFRYYPKDVSWYWLSFIIAILIMAFAIWQNNFLLPFLFYWRKYQFLF